MQKKRRLIIAVWIIALVFSLQPARLSAATMYLPDVTAAMSNPAYWSDKEPAPDEILVSPEEIQKVNEDIIAGKGTGVWDMTSWTQDTYDAVENNNSLVSSGKSDAWECYDDLGACYKDGVELTSFEEAMNELYKPMIANCRDPRVKEGMTSLTLDTGYAICTNRTTLRIFPSDQPLYDAVDDPDFDVQYLTEVAVAEPLIVQGMSTDGKYCHARTSYLQGWVSTADIAFCKNRTEWLGEWSYPDEQKLVVYDDNIMTEDSNSAPETAKRRLPMGTCLRIADRKDWEGKINNRYAYNNYVVWLPVRNDNGTYKKMLSLISEHCKVSEGYLPLTSSNLVKVMFNQLGNAYGWGGMLSAHDCSGYVKTVYSCFGLKLGRNTTNQAAMPVKKFNLSGKSNEEKREIIKALPPGATLTFTGHTMFYLGSEGDKLYIISAVSNLKADGVKLRVRGAVINTLDVTRPNGSTWLENLHTAEIPYYCANAKDISGAAISNIDDITYTGQEQKPKVQVSIAGITLKENVHYTLSYEDNIEVGTARVIINGKGNYSGQAKKDFRIREAGKTISVTFAKKAYVYSGKTITPPVTVKMGKKILDPSSYSLTWSPGRKDVGSYKATVTLKKSYKGTASASFKIIPRGTSPVKLKGGKQAFKVKWKKQASKMSRKRITAYQLQYATNKKFTTGKETVTIRNFKKTSFKVTQLRKKKKYYVRIRTVLVKGNKKYYSKWSKIKAVKTE